MEGRLSPGVGLRRGLLLLLLCLPYLGGLLPLGELIYRLGGERSE